MKIVICASMSAASEVVMIEKKLTNLGYKVHIPEKTELYANAFLPLESRKESVANKIHGDLLRKYFELIKSSDAVLVVNINKGQLKNYIGGNTFLEMGFAHILNKKIFLLNDIPDVLYKDEILAMHPIVINGNLSKIR